MVLMMIVSLVPTMAFAEDDPYIKTGDCGKNVAWTLDISTRTLTISGEGEMFNYSYGSSAPWKQYKSYIETVIIEEGVTSIGAYAFYDGGDTLTNVQLPDTLDSIGSHSFYDNSSLATINLPDSICQIGTYAFAFCDALTSIAIPSGVKTIEANVFAWCGASIYQIPGNVEKIEDKAFYGVKGELQFIGDMPEFVETPFVSAKVNILYPCNNTTWDSVFFSDFGGTLTWEKNHAQIDFSAATVDAENNTVMGECPTCQQICTLTVDQVCCKDRAFSVSISTKTEQTFSVVCIDGCQLTYAMTGSSSISAGSYYSGTYTYSIRIPDTGLHKLRISGSTGGNDLYYTVYVSNHSYSALITAPTCTEQGYTTHTCVCGDSYVDNYTEALGHHFVDGKCDVCGYYTYLPGDVNGDGEVTDADAVYLLYNTFFGDEEYPVNQPCDFNGDGEVTDADAVYLLYYTFFGAEEYPLH